MATAKRESVLERNIYVTDAIQPGGAPHQIKVIVHNKEGYPRLWVNGTEMLLNSEELIGLVTALVEAGEIVGQ